MNVDFELLGDCADLLKRVDDGIRWAYSAGYYPRHRWVGEPPGRDMFLAESEPAPKDETEEERQRRLDKIPGALRDIGQGDYRARQTVQRAATLLSRASEQLEDASLVVALASDRPEVLKALSVAPTGPMGDFLALTNRLSAQIDWLQQANVDLPQRANKHVNGRLVQARSALASIAAQLDRWADHVPQSKQLPPTLCRTCDYRPCPIRNGRIVSRECDTCATWRYRHNGRTRPPSLDDKLKQDSPKDAQARRVAAGEGWGWS